MNSAADCAHWARIEFLVSQEEARRRDATAVRLGVLARSLHGGFACAMAYRMGLAHQEFERARRPPPGGY